MAKEVKVRQMQPPVISANGLIKLDYKTIDELCRIQCSVPEILSVADCNLVQLDAAVFRDKGVATFREYHDKMTKHGRTSLRGMLFDSAKSGSTQAQIWLSKQYLNMSDKQTITSTVDATVNTSIDLTKLTEDELNMYLELTSKSKVTSQPTIPIDKESPNEQNQQTQ